MGCWESKTRLMNENSNYQNQSLKIDGKISSNSPIERLTKFEAEYEVLGQLFTNPLKNVKKIVHKASGKVLCMRVLKKDSVSEKEQRHFARQTEILKSLDHENIIRIIDNFNDSLSSYLITEFCNGGELFDKVVNQIYLQEKQSAFIMRQLLSAINYCHQRNIVHRDIKPENILFESESPDSLIKLTDFKNAKIYTSEKKMRKKVGGVFYLAPEVIKGSYTEKADIWSCGVILYIILCGYPPFNGDSDEKVEEKILLGEEINFKGNEWKDVSNEAKNFLRKLLEYDETKRISAEQALKDDWFKLHRKKSSILEENSNKKPFKIMDPFEIKKIIYEYILNNQGLNDDNLKLKQIFESFDIDHDYHLPWESVLKSFEIFKVDHQDKIGWLDSFLDGLKEDSFNYNEILMLIYNKRIATNRENFERALSVINKEEKGVVSAGELLNEFKKDAMENEDWTRIFFEIQKKNKNEEVMIKDLAEIISKIIAG